MDKLMLYASVQALSELNKNYIIGIIRALIYAQDCESKSQRENTEKFISKPLN